MRRVRVSVEPALWGEFRPEFGWILDTLFVGLGFSWERVEPGESCELAYRTHPPAPGAATVWMRADPERWRRQSDLQLAGVVPLDGWPAFRFSGEPGPQGVSRHDGRWQCPHDRLFDAFWLASGLAEIGWPHGRFGFFELEGSPLFRAGVFREAPASALGTWLQGALEPVVGPPPFPRWAGGARMAACASHDVDYPEVLRLVEPARVLARLGPTGIVPALEVLLGRRHHWHFDDWIADERALGMRSAFNFVAVKGSLVAYALGTPDPFYDIGSPKFRALLPRLADQGFEVGMQPSYRAFRSLDRFLAERHRLESVLGAPVFGGRHHYWHLDPGNPEATLLLHEAAGLLYDASLAFEHAVGWRRGLVWPFFPYSRAERRPVRTLQLPTAWMDDQLFGHARLNGPDPSTQLESLIATVERHGGVFLADMHEYVHDPVLFPHWAETYRDCFGRLLSRPDVRCELPMTIAREWTARAAAIARASGPR